MYCKQDAVDLFGDPKRGFGGEPGNYLVVVCVHCEVPGADGHTIVDWHGRCVAACDKGHGKLPLTALAFGGFGTSVRIAGIVE